jgi:hypothetical protein
VVPHTVLRTENGFDSAGTLQYTNQYIEAVRSDGSMMWKGITGKAQSRRINFANGDLVRTNELLGRKSTYPKKNPGPVPQRSPRTGCVNSADTSGGWVPGTQEIVAGHPAASTVQHRASGP